jgi:hypothetical protein
VLTLQAHPAQSLLIFQNSPGISLVVPTLQAHPAPSQLISQNSPGIPLVVPMPFRHLLL